MANGLSEEMLALATLALGIKGELNDWDDEGWPNRDTRDIVTGKLSIGDFKAENMDYSYSLEGLSSRSPGGRGVMLYSGPAAGDLLVPSEDNAQVMELHLALRVDETKYPAVRLNFALHAKGSRDPLASGYAYLEND
jgi:hypothetical protein